MGVEVESLNSLDFGGTDKEHVLRSSLVVSTKGRGCALAQCTLYSTPQL